MPLDCCLYDQELSARFALLNRGSKATSADLHHTLVFLLLLHGPMGPVRLLLHVAGKEVPDLTAALLKLT